MTDTAHDPHSTTGRRLPGRVRRVFDLVARVVLLMLLLEATTRVALSLNRFWRPQTEPGARTTTDESEAFHPFFQNALRPSARSSTGPEFAGWHVEMPERADGTVRRLLFLGGSTTANDYPSRVRETVAAEHGPTALYNCAASWHTSLHSLLKFWVYADAVHPDVVVVLNNINDFYHGFTPPRFASPQYRDDYSHYLGPLNGVFVPAASVYDGRPVLRPAGRRDPDDTLVGLGLAVARESALVRELVEKLVPRHVPPHADLARITRDPLPDALLLRSLGAFRRNLRNLAQSCSARGVPLVMVTMSHTTEPSRRIFLPPSEEAVMFTNDGSSYVTDGDFSRGMDAFNTVIREVAAETGAILVDPVAAIAAPALFRDEVHLTAAGHEILAGRVAVAVQEALRR